MCSMGDAGSDIVVFVHMHDQVSNFSRPILFISNFSHGLEMLIAITDGQLFTKHIIYILTKNDKLQTPAQRAGFEG